jgi:hypothetical protein
MLQVGGNGGGGGGGTITDIAAGTGISVADGTGPTATVTNTRPGFAVDPTIVTSGTSPYQATVNLLVRVQTATGATTVLAPIAADLLLNTFFGVADISRNASVNPIEVTAPAGWTIQDPANLGNAPTGSTEVAFSGATQFWWADPSTSTLWAYGG